MTRFDFDVIGDSPRLISRPPEAAAQKPKEDAAATLPKPDAGENLAAPFQESPLT